ncbi:J domain-containing protein [Pseudomonas sp. NFACC08-1]|uniref:J domain-containing protein n=1 Tax=Pseudomonas sp. NFACC08-1 TaxID=1566238 RepID=UPI00089AFC6B|nr:J domain-containing protein [Pseudomonas sp. NFACC08-1]SDX98526.1 hypothetical protein SAMN03159474_04366 [Pseudomonas sp. NFACC08-1]
MDIAKCVLDDRVYDALDFSKLHPGELAIKRRHLICTECHATAFFRKASRNGQAACFGAFPHAEGCSLGLSDIRESPVENISSDVTDDLNEHVDSSAAAALRAQAGLRLPSNKRAGASSESDSITGTGVRQNLSLILKKIITLEQNDQNKEKDLGDEYTTAGKYQFVNFNRIKTDQGEEDRGYWGMLTDARLSSEGALWLNAGGAENVSCVIQAEMVDDFFAAYGLSDEEDLAGAFLILIGSLKVSANGKKYIRLAGLEHIALLNAKRNAELADQYFWTKKRKLAFLLTHNQMGVFDQELGIKRLHYVDEDVAKAWRAKLASEFHPDKNQGDTSIDYAEIMSCINRMYKRMVGKA